MACPRIPILLTGVLIATVAGCDSSSESSSSSSPSSPASDAAQTTDAVDARPAAETPIAELPVTITVEQRSTTHIPGSGGKLSLTIDDITHDQVAASVLDAETKALAGPISMTTGKVVPFRVGETTYHLKLEKLSNALVGSDFATFVIDVPPANEAADAPLVLTESQKIERLIEAVAALQGASFLRNGDEHTAAEAAEHLRTKLSAAGDRIQTAEEFIDHIAARSSLSGEDYQIRFADGRTITAREFLQQELEKLETAAAKPAPPE